MSMDYERISDDELNELGLRDLLAIDRTALANERTFLAYARTTIMLVATAVTLVKLFPANPLVQLAGLLILPVAAVVFGIGTRRYWRLSKALRTTRSAR